jgi:hypothetical protein
MGGKWNSLRFSPTWSLACHNGDIRGAAGTPMVGYKYSLSIRT